MPELVVDINIEAEPWGTAILDLDAFVESTLKTALAAVDVSEYAKVNVSVLLTDDAHQRVLNLTWRGIDKSTNVLSFPSGDEPVVPDQEVMLGDLSLAFETIVQEAQDQQKTFADHVSHLLVHGLLHLLGFDHETDDEAEDMETLEIEILQSLGIASPYSA